MGLPKLILRTVNKYLKAHEKTMPKFGSGNDNGNVHKTKPTVTIKFLTV